MKVTIVCEGFDRPSLRLQPWRRIYEIAKRYSTNQNQVTVLSDRQPNQPDTENIDGIPVVRFSGLALAPLIRRNILIEAISKTDPDLVVWCGSPLSASFLPKFGAIRKPIVWDIDSEIHSLRLFRRISFRELSNPHHRSLWQQAVTALIPRSLIRCAANSGAISKIVVPNQSLKSSLCNVGVDPKKVAIIPSTMDIDAETFSDDSLVSTKTGVGLNDEHFIVSYFGSPCSLRGVDTIILSMPKILRQQKNVRLMIFSRRRRDSIDGQTLKAEEENLVTLTKRLNLDGKVQFVTGFLDKQTLTNYIRASDVVVLPFKLVFSEPPLSIFEAMSLGKPVITTDVGGLREIIGEDRGATVQASDTEQLAEAILSFAQNPQKLALFGLNARTYASSLPDWDDVASLFGQVVDSCVKCTAI